MDTLRRLLSATVARQPLAAARRVCWRASDSTKQVRDGIVNLAIPESAVTDSDAPIFVLSAGWRSGSTLLQRLLMSASDVLIWGEPYAHADFIRALADPLRSFAAQRPPPSWFVGHHEEHRGAERPGTYAQTWTADLYPDVSRVLYAHRSFFVSLFASPARERGYHTWGLKETRLDGNYAYYLKWLFPRARILVIYRNPYDAYLSYRQWGDWYDRPCAPPVCGPVSFGRMWRDLVSSLLAFARDVDALLLSYEQLTTDAITIDAINSYTGLTVDSAVLDRRISGDYAVNVVRGPSRLEMNLLKQAVNPLARRLGYSLTH